MFAKRLNSEIILPQEEVATHVCSPVFSRLTLTDRVTDLFIYTNFCITDLRIVPRLGCQSLTMELVW